jgi:hypothetical protein
MTGAYKKICMATPCVGIGVIYFSEQKNTGMKNKHSFALAQPLTRKEMKNIGGGALGFPFTFSNACSLDSVCYGTLQQCRNNCVGGTCRLINTLLC